MQQFQAVLRLDTRNPPGNEHLAAEYLKQVFVKGGIPSQIFALDPNRSNVVARLKGNGKKRPLLIMGHSDVVTVDDKKWTYPPFSATVLGEALAADMPTTLVNRLVSKAAKRRLQSFKPRGKPS